MYKFGLYLMEAPDEENTTFESALKVNKGVEQPPSLNQKAVHTLQLKRRAELTVDLMVEGILRGDRGVLSRAITLVESSLPAHYEKAQQIIERCLPYAGKSFRIGITGVPGVGKSTFIESFGLYLIAKGHKTAVLAVDPSSEISKGSILGDKTRMEMLANHPAAFIRPSPSAGSLGGVARKTRETIILCEAAGFNRILVETVGVGQSETAVQSMVDFFLLLMLSGAGDELQGIKRGIMEMCDGMVINKADGDNLVKAQMARVQYQNALHLFPTPASGWAPRVELCSALRKTGMDDIYQMISDYEAHIKENGYFMIRRKNQQTNQLFDTIQQFLDDHFNHHQKVKDLTPKVISQMQDQLLTPYQAAQKLLNEYFSDMRKDLDRQ